MKLISSIKLCCIILPAALITSCKLNRSGGENRSVEKIQTSSFPDNKVLKAPVIKNNIELEVTGVKLKEAYLTDANNNLLMENVARAGEKIYLVIITDTGWTKEKGKSFIGAAQRILTSGGKVLVDSADIFKRNEKTGLNSTDCQLINVLYNCECPGSKKDYVGQFRIWDKKGAGEIKGEFKFKIEK
jgi:hypothetical protein